jgi:hypothetical protein
MRGIEGHTMDDLLEAQLAGSGKAQAVGAPAVPQPGSVLAPSKGWSASIAVPAGYRLCASGAKRTQCHAKGASDGLWRESAGCGTVAADRMRFRGTPKHRVVSYRYIAAGSACPK